MSRNQSLAHALITQGVGPILRLYFQHRAGLYVPQMDPTFDLRLHNPAIYKVGEVRAWLKKSRTLHLPLAYYNDSLVAGEFRTTASCYPRETGRILPRAAKLLVC